MGFGLGALIHEVHVVQANDEVKTHGDGSRSVVFYADTSEYRGAPIEVKWLSNDQLQITYGRSLTPGKTRPNIGAVKVEYVSK